MRFEHFKTLDSTNAEATRRANAGDVEPVWISADEQTNGKGRQGRDWVSDNGNLFCTGLFHHNGDLSSVAQLSFAAALAVFDGFSEFIDVDLLKIKWPNDVLVDGKKAAGILLESGHYKGGIWVAIGIGVNVSSCPDIPGYETTYMEQHIRSGGKRLSAQSVLSILAQRFEYWKNTYDENGFEPLRAAWLERAAGVGQALTARLPRETIEGVALGMDLQGALEVRTHAGKYIQIHAGDVFFS